MRFLLDRAKRAPAPRFSWCGGAGGFSMTELVIVISIMGVLATITVASFNQFLGGSKDALAKERQESLNQAVHRYAQTDKELLVQDISSSAADETRALRRLQYRNPNEDLALVGSPYFDPRYNPVGSSSDSTYRLRWTGTLFELLKPGKSGTGLLMNFEGTDFTTPFAFPPDFDTDGR
ncbi:MAG: type II secretion system protein [Prosthecobacter sp.]